MYGSIMDAMTAAPEDSDVVASSANQPETPQNQPITEEEQTFFGSIVKAMTREQSLSKSDIPSNVEVTDLNKKHKPQRSERSRSSASQKSDNLSVFGDTPSVVTDTSQKIQRESSGWNLCGGDEALNDNQASSNGVQTSAGRRSSDKEQDDVIICCGDDNADARTRSTRSRVKSGSWGRKPGAQADAYIGGSDSQSIQTSRASNTSK